MTQWAWIDHRGKPVFNFRSENRSFASSDRRLIPSDGFYEFTVPANPKQRLKDKWLFTLVGEPWFWIAGIVKDGCFTMLRSEEHTSELQVTNAHLVCRLLLDKKKKT